MKSWLEHIDPSAKRRVKGLRLITAFGIAAALGTMHDIHANLPATLPLGTLAGGIALWASVSEARNTRPESSRDLALLCAAAVLGAILFALLSPALQPLAGAAPELLLVPGAFLVGYLKRYGVLGAGIGSQFYIGELLAYAGVLTKPNIPSIVVAGLIAMLAAIVPRMLSGPSETPAAVAALSPANVAQRWPVRPELIMGLQAASATLVVVALNEFIGLSESVWAITACTYVVAASASGTVDRTRRRIIGTLVGVPLGLACLPLALHAPLLIWAAAALAMIVYAMSLPERYDIACGAFAFTLIITMAVSGQHSIPLLAARAWETLLGGALGLAAAMFIFPLREPPANG
jgi:hypothetical protein